MRAFDINLAVSARNGERRTEKVPAVMLYSLGEIDVKLQKYKRVPVLHYLDREWLDKDFEHAPLWCSVDLRDGNQALMTR